MGLKIAKANSKKNQGGSSISELLKKDISFSNNPFSSKRKEAFYTELSVLLTSGISLTKAIQLISSTQKKEQIQKLLEDINSDIIAGKTFFETLQSRSYFTPYEYYAIKIGEQTGRLSEIVTDLSLFYKEKNDQRKQVISALSYPVIVLITAIAVVGFMMWYIVPMFVSIFKQRNVELPPITQWVINISSFLTEYIWSLLIGLVISFFLYRYIKKESWFKNRFDSLKLKLPLFGNFFKKVYLSQFTQTMALLTKAKVPVVTAIAMVAEMIQFYPLQSALQSIESGIVKGDKLSDSFAEHPLFDKKMIALLKVAEETNQTEFVFQKLKEQYSAELKYRSQIITAVLNPIFLVIVAIIVGVILIAMYLPMFKLSSIIE